VVALCDLDEDRAIRRRGQFYPDAWITTDYRALLKRNDIEVVDIATHPLERLPLIEAALIAGKHVLSQKPFVLDLPEGERLATQIQPVAGLQSTRMADGLPTLVIFATRYAAGLSVS